MKLGEVLNIIDGQALTKNVDLDMDVTVACGADLMSDVLAFTHPGSLLMTGLTTPQVVRAAQMAEVAAIVFVRDKLPPPEVIALAEEKGIPLLASGHTMFVTCGRLYEGGLPGWGVGGADPEDR
jgi:predicted transcriptional regulator